MFGGFGGDFLKDCFIFKHNEGVMVKSDKEPPVKVFAYQMPTVFDPKSCCVITADWKSKKVVMFNKDHNWSLLKDLQN